jgi:hypothetical protein
MPSNRHWRIATHPDYAALALSTVSSKEGKKIALFARSGERGGRAQQ